MTQDEIQNEWDSFIEYPERSNRMYVTTTSALLFARCIADMAADKEREACAKVCRNESERALWNWKNDISDNQPYWNGAEQMAANIANDIKARGNA